MFLWLPASFILTLLSLSFWFILFLFCPSTLILAFFSLFSVIFTSAARTCVFVSLSFPFCFFTVHILLLFPLCSSSLFWWFSKIFFINSKAERAGRDPVDLFFVADSLGCELPVLHRTFNVLPSRRVSVVSFLACPACFSFTRLDTSWACSSEDFDRSEVFVVCVTHFTFWPLAVFMTSLNALATLQLESAVQPVHVSSLCSLLVFSFLFFSFGREASTFVFSIWSFFLFLFRLAGSSSLLGSSSKTSSFLFLLWLLVNLPDLGFCSLCCPVEFSIFAPDTCQKHDGFWGLRADDSRGLFLDNEAFDPCVFVFTEVACAFVWTV